MVLRKSLVALPAQRAGLIYSMEDYAVGGLRRASPGVAAIDRRLSRVEESLNMSWAEVEGVVDDGFWQRGD